MLLSASTLGAPGMAVADVIDSLVQASVDGVELRIASGEILEIGMAPDELHRVRRAFEAAHIRITGLASYVRIAQGGQDEPVVAELSAALGAAHALGAPTVRVFPGAETEPAGMMAPPRLIDPREDVDSRAADRLSRVADAAERLGVLPVLETHDSHPTGADIAAIAAKVDGPVGVVWDLMHPWRVGEALTETWESLRPWLSAGKGSVQVKDARLPEDATPCLIGEGTLPCEEFGDLLVRQGYDGVVTLELEAAWYASTPPFSQALASARSWVTRHWTQEAT